MTAAIIIICVIVPAGLAVIAGVVALCYCGYKRKWRLHELDDPNASHVVMTSSPAQSPTPGPNHAATQQDVEMGNLQLSHGQLVSLIMVYL